MKETVCYTTIGYVINLLQSYYKWIEQILREKKILFNDIHKDIRCKVEILSNQMSHWKLNCLYTSFNNNFNKRILYC